MSYHQVKLAGPGYKNLRAAVSSANLSVTPAVLTVGVEDEAAIIDDILITVGTNMTVTIKSRENAGSLLAIPVVAGTPVTFAPHNPFVADCGDDVLVSTSGAGVVAVSVGYHYDSANILPVTPPAAPVVTDAAAGYTHAVEAESVASLAIATTACSGNDYIELWRQIGAGAYAMIAVLNPRTATYSDTFDGTGLPAVKYKARYRRLFAGPTNIGSYGAEATINAA